MEEFHVGPYMTAVGDGELLTEIRMPLRRAPAARTRRSSAAPATGRSRRPRPCGSTAGRSPTRGSRSARSGSTTIHLTRAEDLLRGKAPSEELFAQAGEIAAADCSPSADGRGPVDYKRHLAGVLTPNVPAPRGRPPCTRRHDDARVDLDQRREVSRDDRAAQLLVHFIRDTPGLTGTHWGCDTSNCGACVVLMDGKPVKSCTTLAVMCEGHEIRTVESLEVDGQLDPVQMGFHELHALQCGFCTPGMMMTARALLDENPDPTDRDPHRDLRRASAAVPATRTSSARFAGRPTTKLQPRTGGMSMAITENLPSPEHRAADRLRPPEAQGGRALHPRQGNYLDDIRLPGMVHGAVLRSPYAHARIVSIDTSAALAAPQGRRGRHRQGPGDARAGVDADDLLRHAGGARRRQGPLPGPGGRVRDRDRRVLGRDALELIDVEYEPLPAVVNARKALDPDAPLIRDDKEGQHVTTSRARLGGRRRGGDRPRVRQRRRRRRARHHLPALPPGAAGDLRHDRRLRPVRPAS
jgi:carbon-monoxide dehydrogenase small subunit